MPKVVVSVDFSDMSEEVKSAMRQQLLLGLEAIGLEMEGYAKDNSPVDTGTLRNSITYEVVTSGEDAVYVGTNVEYAIYVEYGEKAKHTTGQAHFLRDACVDHTERYKSILEDALRE